MMQTLDTFPHRVHVLEHVEIPMPDGARLAARIWLPETAGERPLPAILEYIPYRKRDLTRHRDAITHTYLAGHGYACVRVDLRGSGSPTAYSSISTASRRWMTAWRRSPGSRRSRGATAMWA